VSYRAKVIVFFFSALALFFAAVFAYSTSQALSRLDQIEAERDQWQRPAEVLAALDLKSGDSAVDLGCGSGYFSLRLSQPVGSAGRVIAEDIRSLPLVFLWLRTHLKHLGNISIVRGEPADPQLPSASITAVLIANTYHELRDTQPILAHVKQSLVSGGRLVVVDRAPSVAGADTMAAEHEISPERVERELRQAGFDLVSRVDRFVPKDPDNESWWLIVARNP